MMSRPKLIKTPAQLEAQAEAMRERSRRWRAKHPDYSKKRYAKQKAEMTPAERKVFNARNASYQQNFRDRQDD